jgi:hypothetical protein
VFGSALDLYTIWESGRMARGDAAQLYPDSASSGGGLSMRTFAWAVVGIGLVLWIVHLQRRLRAAEMRGDMYRDIAVRLDRRVVELGGQER